MPVGLSPAGEDPTAQERERVEVAPRGRHGSFPAAGQRRRRRRRGGAVGEFGGGAQRHHRDKIPSRLWATDLCRRDIH